MKARILLVEDEPGLVLTVSDLLRAEGHVVDTALDGDAGMRKALAQRSDVIVLDVMLPGRGGFEVCKALRERGYTGAILMLTARTQVQDRVFGLRAGADDYLSKPFDPSELVARIDALMRRVHRRNLPPVTEFRFGDVRVDFGTAQVVREGRPVSLAAKEIQLLRYLVDHRGEVVSREQLLEKVWEYQASVSTRTVDVHVAWLRQKLEENPRTPKHILTVRGEGYRFSP